MAYISYRNGPHGSGEAWWTCGCGGAPVTRVALIEGNVELIVPAMGFKSIGPNDGLMHHYQLGGALINLNIDPADAAILMRDHNARYPSPQERKTINGNVARPTANAAPAAPPAAAAAPTWGLPPTPPVVVAPDTQVAQPPVQDAPAQSPDAK